MRLQDLLLKWWNISIKWTSPDGLLDGLDDGWSVVGLIDGKVDGDVEGKTHKISYDVHVDISKRKYKKNIRTTVISSKIPMSPRQQRYYFQK